MSRKFAVLLSILSKQSYANLDEHHLAWSEFGQSLAKQLIPNTTILKEKYSQGAKQ